MNVNDVLVEAFPDELQEPITNGTRLTTKLISNNQLHRLDSLREENNVEIKRSGDKMSVTVTAKDLS